jgi:hypothetical protein
VQDTHDPIQKPKAEPNPPVQDVHPITPQLKAKGKVPAQGVRKTINNGPGFRHLPFDLNSIVWDKNCGRPTKFKANGSTAPVKDKATEKTVQKPRFQNLAIDPPLTGRKTYAVSLFPSEVRVPSDVVN